MKENLPYPFWKRLMDVSIGILGIIILIPLWLAISLSVKLDSRGPIIVKLCRVSSGRVIKIYKFRSMVIDAETQKKQLLHLNERSDGMFFKIKDDPRITRVGKIIRKFRVDEIPQLLNVIKGDMAIVGPRPHELEEVRKYPEKFVHIPRSRAGITGLSQVSGASSLKWRAELELDDFYVNNVSFFLDMKIIWKTVGILLSDPTGV